MHYIVVKSSPLKRLIGIAKKAYVLMEMPLVVDVVALVVGVVVVVVTGFLRLRWPIVVNMTSLLLEVYDDRATMRDICMNSPASPETTASGGRNRD